MFNIPEKQLDHELEINTLQNTLKCTLMKTSHDNVVVKLSKVDAMISKIRHSVDIQVLKLVCHVICESCSFDASLIYHKLKNFLFYKKISQDNVFIYRNAPTDPLSKNLATK